MDFPIALDYIRLGMRCLMDIVQVFAHSGLSACRSGSMKIRPKSVFLGRACIALAGAGGVLAMQRHIDKIVEKSGSATVPAPKR